jgi:hypothetical protein
MTGSKATEAIDHDRRRLLGTAAMGIAVAGAASLFPSRLAAAPAGGAIRPFRADVPAWEEPELFSAELRAASRPLR